ncbi:MAG: NYN domain-containing protein [Candidatus Atribacteria bacterium]|nr:NYN domain-containing protein [Candidatus Atribacteria bacterium]
MERTAVFIDGGYLRNIILKLNKNLQIDYGKLAEWMSKDSYLLRTYYYDCLPYQSNPPTPDERKRMSRMQSFLKKIEQLQDFTIRHGTIVKRGNGYEQKGVDVQLSIDLTLLSSKSKITQACILTGDSDFVPAICVAKNEGVKIILFHGPKETYHRDLWNNADRRIEISSSILNKMKL